MISPLFDIGIAAMKRLLIALVLLLVLAAGAFVATFWHAGGRVEAAFAEQKDFIAGQSALKVVDQRFERGIFTSRAEVSVELQGQAAAVWGGLAREVLGSALKEPPRLTWVHEIHHGPFPAWRQGDFSVADARFLTRLRINPEIAAKLPEVFGDGAPVLLTTDFFSDNNAVSQVAVPAIQRDLKGGTQLTWQGMSGEVRFSRAYDAFQTHLAMPRLELVSGVNKAVLANLAVNGDMKRGGQGLWLGNGGLSVAEMSVSATGMTGKIAGLAYRGSVRENGEFIDVGTEFSLKNAEFRDIKMGQARLALNFGHLHGPTLGKMRAEMDALDRQPLPDEQRTAQAAALVLGLYGELMKRQPEVAVKELSFAMPEGDLKFSLAARLLSVPDDGAGPMALLGAIEASADLDVAEDLAKKLAAKGVKEQLRSAMAEANAGKDAAEVEADLDAHATVAVSAQIAAAIEQGLVQRDGERLKATARWETGGLRVNGHPLATPLGAPAAAPSISAPPPKTRGLR